MRIGVDLLWVRPGICGGTESYIRNLLDGFVKYSKQDEFVLYTTQDNANTFDLYEQCDFMQLSVCPVNCAVQWKRILWENLFLARRAEREKIDIMFIPVYSMPQRHGNHIPYVTVIHDLQGIHFPQYFSRLRLLFLKNKWNYACKNSAQLVTDSDFCKKDIIHHYPFVKDRIKTIYAPIVLSQESTSFDELGKKYKICAGKYFYCVSSMLPHKNLSVILETMSELKKTGEVVQLVLSGVGGQDEEFSAMLKKLQIEDIVIRTGFVTDSERDGLYENCELFLFPSIFEGFGMPPVEAMKKGRVVVTTRESSLEEITDGRAVYVDHPEDVTEWVQKIRIARTRKGNQELFPQYEPEVIVKQFLEVFQDVVDLQ